MAIMTSEVKWKKKTFFLTMKSEEMTLVQLNERVTIYGKNSNYLSKGKKDFSCFEFLF